MTLSATTLSFTAAPADAQTVTLSNTGVATLTITTIVATGNFEQTNNCPASVEPGEACTIRVTFTSRVATAPTISSGIVSITDNAPTSPQTFALTGPVVSTATARLTPNTLAFGTQTIGTTSAVQAVTLSNVANGAATVGLTVFNIEAGGDFRVASSTCGGSLAAGSSCTMTVVFAPTTRGDRSGTLTVFHNGPLGLVIMPLSGTGQ